MSLRDSLLALPLVVVAATPGEAEAWDHRFAEEGSDVWLELNQTLNYPSLRTAFKRDLDEERVMMGLEACALLDGAVMAPAFKACLEGGWYLSSDNDYVYWDLLPLGMELDLNEPNGLFVDGGIGFQWHELELRDRLHHYRSLSAQGHVGWRVIPEHEAKVNLNIKLGFDFAWGTAGQSVKGPQNDTLIDNAEGLRDGKGSGVPVDESEWKKAEPVGGLYFGPRLAIGVSF